MAYRIKTQSVTVTGSLSATADNSRGVDTDGPETPYVLTFQAQGPSGGVTATLQLGMLYPYDEVTGDEIGRYSYSGNVQASSTLGGASTITEIPPVDQTDDLPPMSGTFSLTCDMTLWADLGIIAPSDSTDGVFQTPPPATLRLYWALTEGSTAVSTITAFGVTATNTDTVPTGTVITCEFSASQAAGVQQSPSNSYGPTATFGPNQASITSMATMNGAALTGTQSASYEWGSVSLGGGVHAEIINVGPDGEGYGDGAFATGGLTASPDKAFSVSGVNKSVAASYPETMHLTCVTKAGVTQDISASGGYSVGGTQRKKLEAFHIQRTGAYGPDGPPGSGNTIALDEGAPIQVVMDPASLQAQGEYVVSASLGDGDPPETILRYQYNDLVYLHCWPFPGLTLTQAASQPVDPCTSLTNWTGATMAGGHFHGAGAAPMTLTLPAPGLDFSGYRYLRLQSAQASAACPVTLSLGGKTFSARAGTSASDLDFDLLDPTSSAATTDTTDTKWPMTSDPLDTSDGPLWGVSVAQTLSLSVPSGTTLSLGGVGLVRKTSPTCHFLSEWAVRPGDVPNEVPPVSTGTDGGNTTTAYAHRGLVCDTDGRQSLEALDMRLTHYETGSGEGDSWEPSYVSVRGLADYINSDYSRVPSVVGTCGWTAAASGPASSGGDALADLLSADTGAGACWTCYGWRYDGRDWTSGVGQAGGFSGNVLVTEVTDFPPGTGDIFGLGPPDPPAGDDTLYLGASWCSRAQARVTVLYSDHGGPASGKAVSLTPGPGELQPAGGAVGSGTTDGQGYCYTGGTGLDGYTTTGAGDSVRTGPSPGVVTDTADG